MLDIYFQNINYFDNNRNIQMLARGPNTLNLINYTQDEVDEHSYDPNEMAQIVEGEEVNMQQQFDNYIKDIQRYDDILTKVAKSIDDITAQQHFITDFYPQFALDSTYESDQEKRIISPDDIQLGRVLQNIQRSNRNYKQEMKGWLFQFAKKTRLSQVLISQNKLLRKFISLKNKDIVKLIQAITTAHNPELSELNDSLSELKQQNAVLTDHLKEVRQSVKQKKDEQNKIISAYHNAQQNKIQIQSKIKAGEDQQQHYSKMISLLQASLQDTKKRQKRLVQQRQRLLKVKKQYETHEQFIQKQIDACKIDREQIDRQLKTKFKNHQSEKQRLMNQIQELTQKIKRIKQQTRNVQDQLTRNQFKLEQFTNVCNDLDKKSNDLNNNLAKGQQELSKLQSNQIQLLSNIDVINLDIQMIKQQLKYAQKLQEQINQKNKKQIKKLQQQQKEEISKYQQLYSKAQWQASKQIIQQKTGLAIKKKQIQQLQNKISLKKRQIQSFKQQLIEVKQNQVLAANLKSKLRQAQKK